MKRLLSLILFIGSFACAMDTTEQNKKPKYQIEHDNQTIEITQQEFNALKNQSVTIARMLKDADDDEEPIYIYMDVEKIKEIVLPLLVLIDQNQTNELQDKLKNASLKDLIYILNTANYLDSETLLHSCINQIASKKLQLKPKVLELLGQLPAEMHLMISSELPKNNPFISALLQRTTIPCLHTLTGHTDFINSVAISSDNKTVVTGSDDGTAKIWDINSGQGLHTLTGHTKFINSVAISSDNTTVVTGSDDTTVKIWDIQTGQCLNTLTDHADSIYSVAISPDNKTVITGSYDRTAKVWDIQTGKCLRTLIDLSKLITSIAISSDSHTVVTSSWDRTAKIWDVSSGTSFQPITGHTNSISSVAISSESTKVVTGSDDGTAKIWDINSGLCLHTLTGHTYCINSVAISSDKVVTGSRDGTAKIWDINSGQCLQTLTGHTEWIRSVAISSDSTKVVTGLVDGTAKIGDMTKFNTLFNYLHKYITIEQVLLLKAWHAAQQINQKLDLSNPQIKKAFDSLPDEIKEIIKPSIIRRIKKYCYNNPWRTAVGLGAAALTGYGLWKYFKSDN